MNTFLKNRTHAIEAATKLYAALRFYATGAFYLVMGDVTGISEPSMCKIIVKVTKAIVKLKSQYVSFPLAPDHRQEIQQGF